MRGLGSLIPAMGGAPLPVLTSASYTQFDTTGTGVPVVLTGTGLTGCTAVTVAGADVIPSAVTDTSVTFTAPAHVPASSISVTVTTPGGTSNALTCSYWGPEAANVPLLSHYLCDWGITEAGGVVTEMADRAGNVDQIGTAGPYEAKVGAADSGLGGRHTLTTTATSVPNGFRFTTSGAWPSAASAVTVMHVGANSAAGGALWSKGVNTDPYQLFWRSGVNTVQFYKHAGASTTVPSVSSLLRPIVTMFEDLGLASEGSTKIYYDDIGAPKVSSVARWNADTKVVVGFPTAGVYGDTGRFAELAAWNGRLDKASRLKLATYLNDARGYGLAVTVADVPEVRGVSHAVIDIAGGGQRVVIEVDDSTGCTGATIGGVALTSFTIDDSTHVSGVPGAHAAGVTDVIVSNAVGASLGGEGMVEYWSPAQLATGSKDTFLDAAKGITLDTGKVASWASQGSTARSFAQSTASARPTPIASAFGTMQGISFDGVDDVVGTPYVGPIATYSTFAVAKWTSTDTTAATPAVDVPLTIVGSTGWGAFGASADQVAWKNYDKSIVTRGASLNDGTPHLIGVTCGSAAVKLYLGDAQQGADFTPGDANAYVRWVGGGRLAADVTMADDFFAGALGAVLVVEGVISGANIGKLNSWAQQRFGVA